MSHTWIQNAFKPVKEHLPAAISNPIRSVITAFLTPILYSWRTGHFRSSFKMAAVSKYGTPLPWYTYPCIDFLKYRSYTDKTILEFGAGQSTLWWASQAKQVISLEGDPHWIEKLRTLAPENVTFHLVAVDNAANCVQSVNDILGELPNERFDIVVIDGLWRHQLYKVAARIVSENGAIICDNAENYDVYLGFRNREFLRVDFFGNAPGVILPHCTSICFRPGSFLFSPKHPIPIIALQD
jgi:hypothetical protein